MTRWFLVLAVAAAVAAALLLLPTRAPEGVPGPADEAIGREGVPETDESPYHVTEDAGAGTITREPNE